MNKLALVFIVIVLSIQQVNAKELIFTIKSEQANNGNAFTLAFPMNTLALNSNISLWHENAELPAEFYAHLNWPQTTNVTFVRGLTVIAKNKLNYGEYKVVWRESNEAYNIAKTSKLAQANSFVDAEMDVNWLSHLLYAPLQSVNEGNNIPWFENAYIKFATFITDDTAIAKYKKGRQSFKQAAPWLYDRPYTLYQLYLKTGDVTWREHAHSAALKYRENINEKGYFSLKKQHDMKYLIPNGLILDYLFYPNEETLKVIDLMYKNSLYWAVQYHSGLGFWTERHLASAMSLALAKWEVSGDNNALVRLNALIKGTLNSVSVMEGVGGESWGCVRHPYSAHEGGQDNTQICSVWMSALVVEQLWRYYRITHDLDSKKLIKLIGNQVLNGGLYGGWGPHMKTYKVPYYIRYFDDHKKREIDQWTDMQHACDVAAMVAKSGYLTKLDGKSIVEHSNVVKLLMKTCKKTLFRAKVVKVWGVSPLRKFNWWFSSTGNLPWLIEQL